MHCIFKTGKRSRIKCMWFVIGILEYMTWQTKTIFIICYSGFVVLYLNAFLVLKYTVQIAYPWPTMDRFSHDLIILRQLLDKMQSEHKIVSL